MHYDIDDNRKQKRYAAGNEVIFPINNGAECECINIYGIYNGKEQRYAEPYAEQYAEQGEYNIFAVDIRRNLAVVESEKFKRCKLLYALVDIDIVERVKHDNRKQHCTRNENVNYEV